jgi:hypothetical protein
LLVVVLAVPLEAQVVELVVSAQMLLVKLRVAAVLLKLALP